MVGESTLASQFGPEELEEFLHPQEHESTPPDDRILRLSLMNFMSYMNQTQKAYEDGRQNLRVCYPEIELLSLYQAERRARILSGIVIWEHHMCFKTCLGFTGPYQDLERCPNCGESRYIQKDLDESNGERKVPRKVFTTFPLGPQLQALRTHPQSAEDMHYRWEKTLEILRQLDESGEFTGILDDILCGKAYIDLVREGTIGEYDSVLMLSMDGAQLHPSKNPIAGCISGFLSTWHPINVTRFGIFSREV